MWAMCRRDVGAFSEGCRINIESHRTEGPSFPHLASHVAQYFEPAAALGFDHSHDGLVPCNLCPLLAFAPDDIIKAIALGANLKVGLCRCRLDALDLSFKYQIKTKK